MPYRIIYSLQFDLEPLSGDPLGSSTTLIVQLNRKGMSYNNSRRNVWSRSPKKRAIDLRTGDQILCGGKSHVIKSVVAYRDRWLTEAQARDCEGDHGYLYRIIEQAAPKPSMPDSPKGGP